MSDAIERAWRDDRVRLVAAVARRTRDLDLAEDVVQDAFFEAAARWPNEGVPRLPAAWLFSVAWRRAVDVVRRSARLAPLDAHVISEPFVNDATDEPFDDDVLALILSCTHPALDLPSRIALTLRHVAGLRPREIAAAFLTTEAATTKRLARARRKMRESGIRFVLPEPESLAARMHDVRTIVLLIFNEGYLAHADGPPLRDDLRRHAIWLARALYAMRPGDLETRALLALCLLHDARSDARIVDGRLIPFERQDRSRWDHSAIAEARMHLAATAHTTPGPFALMAAIAALHVGPAGQTTRWLRVAQLYDLLLARDPSPIVALNRAYAIGRAWRPEDGVRELEPLLSDERLATYAPLQAAAADLLSRAGDARAEDMWRRASLLAPEGAQRDGLLEAAEGGGYNLASGP